MTSNIKKVFGMAKKKSEDADEDIASYTNPSTIHSTEPPSRNSRGFAQPHYPPPRPQHSPNPRRKSPDTTTQVKKVPQVNDTARNSAVEPKRAPPRPNIAKKESSEDDYCDPIDVQRKENFQPDLKNKANKDDYCEPWDTTKKTDFGNAPRKTSHSDDEHNEYMDPYDTGKDGIIEKRRSRGIGKDFHSKIQQPNNDLQRKSIAENNQVPDPRKATSDDYDMPWEWKKQMQMQGKITAPKPKHAPQSQKPKPAAPKDDYDEPWEKKQGYLMKGQPPTGGKPRSPVPLPRVAVHTPKQGPDDLYEQPCDSILHQGNGVEKNNLYETPWEEQNTEVNKSRRGSSPRRASQPAFPTTAVPSPNRKSSQSAVGELADYDTPWEYKNAKKYAPVGPPKPTRVNEIVSCEVNPDLPLDDQSWYHGPIKRHQAENLLRDAPDCSFLVRNSESSKKDFSLSMKNNENYLHLKIVRQIDGQFILGQFSKPFMDIPKVIHHYSRNKLNIRGAEHKYLKHPVADQPEYHTIEPDDADSHL